MKKLTDYPIYNFNTNFFLAKEAKDDLVLVPVIDDIYFMSNVIHLNQTATELLKELDGKKTLTEVCELILSRYDVEKDVVEKDIIQFIEQALEKNILEEIN
ncbi:MAG: PqqD family protein [Marinilabiliaceae bacterium]|nr:PqqD family protein [Marinilabiliaceae bacterium]